MVNILWLVIIISKGQPENLEPSATTDEVEAGHLTVSSETRVDINSGEENIVQYFNVDDNDNSNESSGQSGDTEQFQPSRLSPAPVTRSRPPPPLPLRK